MLAGRQQSLVTKEPPPSWWRLSAQKLEGKRDGFVFL